MQSYKPIKVKPYIGGVSKQSEFDPICHIELEEERIGNDEEDEEENEYALDDQDKEYERLKVDGLYEHWLHVEPSQVDFASMLRESLLDEGLECLRRFERFSRHKEL